jgi:tetratricopeptide (TPR) repeat protein
VFNSPPAWRQPAIVFVIALAARLVHLWQMRETPFFSVLMGDSRGYDEWAQRIAGGDWLGTEVFYQAPLYPYFLGVIYSVFGRDLFVVRVCQAIVGALSCATLSLTAERFFSRRAGLIAGLGLGLYAPAIFFDALIQKTVLDVFLLCLALFIVSRLVDSPEGHEIRDSRGWSILAGWLCLGLALGGLGLVRENALVFVAVILVWIAVRREPIATHPRPGRGLMRARATEAAALVLGVVVVLAPVAVRNYAVGGGLYVTTSQFGPNFYIGNNPRSDGTYMSLRPGRGAPEYERQDATELAEHALGHRLTPSEVSAYWSNRALDYIGSQPGAWLKLVGRKVALLWNADEMLDTESQASHAEWSMLLALGGWVGHFGLLVPLALIGVIATWHDRARLWLLYAMTIAYAASVIAFYVFARYRFPLVPLLMLFAAAGLCGLGALLRAFSPARTWVLATAVATVAVFVNWPILSTTMMRAVTENNLAVALQESGRLDEAIGHYRRSAELSVDYAPAYNNMGTALRAQGRVEDAITAYQRALAAMPDYPDAHYNLANALLEQNRPGEAADHLRAARLLLPSSARVHNNLGKALAEQGRFEEAATELRAAVALDPESGMAHRNLGNVLASRGDASEALAHLQRAFEIDPGDAEAGYDFGTLLLQGGRIDDAVSVFRAVVRVKPDYAEAHNNLGIALGSQGRLPEAIAQFEEALRLQPGFADARRNLDIARRVR